MSVALDGSFPPEDLSPDAFRRLRLHPAFRAVIEDYCRTSLDQYGRLDLASRWLTSDLGRQSLSRAATILQASFGRLTARDLVDAALRNGTCSRGRALAYLDRAALNGMFAPEIAGAPMDRIYRLEPRFFAAMTPPTELIVRMVARLAPEILPAADAIADPRFHRQFMRRLGALSVERRDLFVGPEMPVVLFLYRDGGERILEQLIVSQPKDRARLLQQAPVSRSSLARGAFTSRTHVRRLLEAGAASGQLTIADDSLTISPQLSDDVERHFALVFEITRTVAAQCLAAGDRSPVR